MPTVKKMMAWRSHQRRVYKFGCPILVCQHIVALSVRRQSLSHHSLKFNMGSTVACDNKKREFLNMFAVI